MSDTVINVQNLGNHYTAEVKLLSKGDLLKKPDGSDVVEIDFIRQGANFKAETWYFTQ